MIFLRHENFATLPFWPTLAPNSCMRFSAVSQFLNSQFLNYPNRTTIKEVMAILSRQRFTLPPWVPPREIHKNFMHASISCYTVSWRTTVASTCQLLHPYGGSLGALGSTAPNNYLFKLALIYSNSYCLTLTFWKIMLEFFLRVGVIPW